MRKRSITTPWNFIASTVIILLKWLFSQTLLLLEGEKANCHCFHVEKVNIFEIRAPNLLRLCKIAITTLKSASGFEQQYFTKTAFEIDWETIWRFKNVLTDM